MSGTEPIGVVGEREAASSNKTSQETRTSGGYDKFVLPRGGCDSFVGGLRVNRNRKVILSRRFVQGLDSSHTKVVDW